MAKEEQKNDSENKTPEVPEDNELFAGEIQEQPSQREVFAGDEDFHESFAESIQDESVESDIEQKNKDQLALFPVRSKRFSNIQIVLMAAITITSAILLYSLLTLLLSHPGGNTQQPSPPRHISTTAIETFPSAGDSNELTPRQAGKSENPLSLKVAEDYYLRADYRNAYCVYEQLYQNLAISQGQQEQLLKDLLSLRMALCMQKMGEYSQAEHLLDMVSASRSPVLTALANYYRSLIQLDKKQYLQARTRAYKAIASSGAITFNRHWVLSFQKSCYFLAAELLSREVLSLCDADKNIPSVLWKNRSIIDPFTDLTEAQLHSLLNSGVEQLNKALLGPVIREIDPAEPSVHFSVICHGAPVEELFARFAAHVKLDLFWDTGLDSIEIRKRPVSLCLSDATTQEFATVAAGLVGLLANLEDKNGATMINISDPMDYPSLSEHISTLTAEAILLWHEFLIKFHDDKRIPNAHFALGLLLAQNGQTTEAVAEYKLVANRFSLSLLAPYALLESSKLKTSLHDYHGAKADLKQLVEQYRDTNVAVRGCLYLAEATVRAKLYKQAARMYRRVYNLDFSSESTAAAALGMGKCFFQIQDYQSAEQWLTRYINLTKDRQDDELQQVYVLLGRTKLALGKQTQACKAFRYALSEKPDKKSCVQVISALAQTKIEKENFIEVLDILENTNSYKFSYEELTEMLLLKSRILRRMGLLDKAIAIINSRAEYISETQLRAGISLELARCCIEKGDWETAYDDLTKILAVAEGLLAHEIALELAGVCLQLDKDSQAISICSQLLELEPLQPVKQKALNFMAIAFKNQKNYDKAAAVLMGKPTKDS